MHANTSLPVFPADISGAVLSHYVNVAEDGTLCFVSDKIHRTCRDCGTIFTASAYQTAFAGPPVCPFCGEISSQPIPVERLS